MAWKEKYRQTKRKNNLKIMQWLAIICACIERYTFRYTEVYFSASQLGGSDRFGDKCEEFEARVFSSLFTHNGL